MSEPHKEDKVMPQDGPVGHCGSSVPGQEKVMRARRATCCPLDLGFKSPIP